MNRNFKGSLRPFNQRQPVVTLGIDKFIGILVVVACSVSVQIHNERGDDLRAGNMISKSINGSRYKGSLCHSLATMPRVERAVPL